MVIDPKDAFLHVIYEYRCLVNAGYAWNIAGPSGDQEAIEYINKQIPEASTIFQDSLLAHVRTLIDFYTKSSNDVTDIELSWFSDGHALAIDSTLFSYLEGYKHSISVQALHLTAWRDPVYRVANNTTTRGSVRGRPNWNTDNVTLVNKLIEALKEISKQPSKWKQPFEDLHDASTQRLVSGSAFDWPPNLGAPSDVSRYLIDLGL
jgi:hypothetical protein